MELTDFDALSFDCYGTLIDWEAGLAAALRPWAQAHDIEQGEEQLLNAFAGHATAAEEEHPTELYPDILVRALHALAVDLGASVVPTSDWASPSPASLLPRTLARTNHRRATSQHWRRK